jgi:hypothetical protein
LLGHSIAEIDKVISNDAEPDPTLHSGLAFIFAAVESMSALSNADAPLASCAPFFGPGETSASSVRAAAPCFWWSD